MISLKQLLWIIPFCCFIGSYFVLHCFLATTSIITPSLIGKNLQDAIQILSDNNLNARILSQKEDIDIMPGTILSQMPASNRKIRPHQSVFFVISKKPVQKKVPNFQQKNKTLIEKIASEERISLKTYSFPSNYAQDCCIGQLPEPDQPLEEQRMTLYFSSGLATKPVILPSFKQRTLTEVTAFLTDNSIKYSIIHAKAIEQNHTCKGCTVIDQKPLAGSLIDLKKPLTIQLFAH